MFKERLVVNLPAEQAYSSLLNYLKEHHIEKAEVVRSSKPYYIKVKVKQGYLIADIVSINILSQEKKCQILIDFNFNGRIITHIVIYLFFIILFISLKRIELSFWFFFPAIVLVNDIMKFKKSFKDKISNYFIGIEHVLSPDQESSKL